MPINLMDVNYLTSENFWVRVRQDESTHEFGQKLKFDFFIN